MPSATTDPGESDADSSTRGAENRRAHHDRASTAQRTASAPASSSTAAAASSVAPVVITSSTSSTRPSTGARRRSCPRRSRPARRDREHAGRARRARASAGASGAPSASATAADDGLGVVEAAATHGLRGRRNEGHALRPARPLPRRRHRRAAYPSTGARRRSPASLCSTTARDSGGSRLPSAIAASNDSVEFQHSVHTSAPNGAPQRGQAVAASTRGSDSLAVVAQQRPGQIAAGAARGRDQLEEAFDEPSHAGASPRRCRACAAPRPAARCGQRPSGRRAPAPAAR